MKKMMMSLAAMAVMAVLAACGGGAKNANGTDAEKESSTSVSYTNYVDAEKGFSFDVPEGLVKFDGPEAMGATEFRLDGLIKNGVSANVSENFDGEYTQEQIDADFAEATLSLTGTPDTKEKTADGYIITESYKDMGYNGMQRVLFKGDKRYNIIVYWEDENVSKYGGDVAKHVIDSFKLTE